MVNGGCALVHCRAGKMWINIQKSKILFFFFLKKGMSRSSTIVLAHLLEYHHMLLKDAWKLLYTKHPIASPITVCILFELLLLLLLLAIFQCTYLI
jgi:protein-tyrosine phosphatase